MRHIQLLWHAVQVGNDSAQGPPPQGDGAAQRRQRGSTAARHRAAVARMGRPSKGAEERCGGAPAVALPGQGVRGLVGAACAREGKVCQGSRRPELLLLHRPSKGAQHACLVHQPGTLCGWSEHCSHTDESLQLGLLIAVGLVVTVSSTKPTCYAQVLAAWRVTAGREGRNRGVAGACMAQLQTKMLSAALGAWQSAAAEQRQLQGALAVCLSRHQHRALRRAWDAWRARSQRTQQRSARLALALAGRRSRILRGCCLFWRWHARREAQLRARLREAAAGRRARTLGGALRAWAQRAKRGVAVRARLRLVLYRMLEARLAAALRGWRAAAALRRGQRSALAAAALRLRHRASHVLLHAPCDKPFGMYLPTQ